MSHKHRVVITGVGIVSCLGAGKEAVGQALRAGRSGIAVDPERVKLGFRSPLTGVISDFDPTRHLSRKERKSMTDFSVQAHAASLQAFEQSGAPETDWQNERSGLIFGADSSCLDGVEQVDLMREHHDTSAIGSGYVFRTMTSNITMNLNTIFKTQGACWTLSSACSSGGHAVGQAANLIALGQQERMLCGGAQELNWQSICSFDALGAFSTNTENPHAASRPFDRSRDGLVPSGGAAALVLERYDLAKKRGARILGEVVSYAFSSDGCQLSVPSRGGLARAMRGALRTANIQANDIDYLCAHATSTPAGDKAEAENISDVFGTSDSPRISSLKSMVGHELWMAGASQVVYCTIMAEQGFIAPNINLENLDESAAKLNIISKTIDEPPQNVMCNAAGFGGTNSCLVLRFGSLGR